MTKIDSRLSHYMCFCPDQGPVLEVRAGAPNDSKLELALELLRARDALSESDGYGPATGKDNEVEIQSTMEDTIGEM